MSYPNLAGAVWHTGDVVRPGDRVEITAPHPKRGQLGRFVSEHTSSRFGRMAVIQLDSVQAPTYSIASQTANFTWNEWRKA